MTKQTAGLVFLTVCLVIAALLTARVISSVLSGIIFAVALICFGILSKGFTKK